MPAGTAVVRIRSNVDTTGTTKSLVEASLASSGAGSARACGAPDSCGDGAKASATSTIVQVSLQGGARTPAIGESTRAARGRAASVGALRCTVRDGAGVSAGSTIAHVGLEVGFTPVGGIMVAIAEPRVARD
jgi:hypothetical protein